MGRPSKLTPDRAERLIQAIRAGSYADVAARAVGIDPSSYYNWMKRGREAERKENGDAANDEDFPYVELFESIKEAEAIAENEAIQRIQTAAQQGTWTADAWYLERKFPDRWGRQEVRKVTLTGGPEDNPVHVAVQAELSLTAFLDEREADQEATDESVDGRPLSEAAQG